MTKAVAQWPERQVDFPHWTEAPLRAQPETHVGEWVARTGYAVDKLYSTEEREGGARVVAADLPNITREQLSVFTASEWERVKSEYSFEAWTERARAVR